jgi:hypothetical protein
LRVMVEKRHPLGPRALAAMAHMRPAAPAPRITTSWEDMAAG